MEPLLLTAILALMLAGFVAERFPVDVTAILALGLLLAFGLVTPEQAVAGFSNTAVVTVMLMFILSEALTQSGAVANVGHHIVRLARGVQGQAAQRVVRTQLDEHDVGTKPCQRLGDPGQAPGRGLPADARVFHPVVVALGL